MFHMMLWCELDRRYTTASIGRVCQLRGIALEAGGGWACPFCRFFPSLPSVDRSCLLKWRLPSFPCTAM